MKLNFNLEDVHYLKLEYVNNTIPETTKLAIKEKKENEFVAIGRKLDHTLIKTPQKATLGFVCHDGLYSTTAEINKVEADEEYTYYYIQNPATLDYQQNREYYRILAKYDCIYTIYTEDGNESFTAETYDISAGGVSIIIPDNAISKDECSIVIMLPDGDLKSHVKFVRCDVHNDDYRLSFEFTDLSARDIERLTELCVNKQVY